MSFSFVKQSEVYSRDGQSKSESKYDREILSLPWALMAHTSASTSWSSAPRLATPQ